MIYATLDFFSFEFGQNYAKVQYFYDIEKLKGKIESNKIYIYD